MRCTVPSSRTRRACFFCGRKFPHPWALLAGLAWLAGCAPRADERPIDPAAYAGVIRLACVGDSLTGGPDCWPFYLAQMLGDKWEVANFGLGGSTVLNFGDKPYVKEKLPEVVAYKPEVVVCLLGTNDSKPRHWYYKSNFEIHYGRLIEIFQQLNPQLRLWVCLPPPAFPGQWGIDDGRIREMLPVIRRVASKHGIPVIDLYAPLKGHPEFFPDQVHPNRQGSFMLAEHIYQALTGQVYHGAWRDGATDWTGP